MDLGIFTYSFLIINFILLVLGIVRIFVTIFFAIISVFIFSQFKSIYFIPIVSNAILIGAEEEAISLLGILAGNKNNVRFLLSYEFLMIIMMVIKLVGIKAFSRDKSILVEDIQLSLEDLMNEYGVNNLSLPIKYRRSEVDDIQQTFHCCGLNGPHFWVNDSTTPYTKLPKSCCESSVNICSLENSYKNDCLSAVNIQLSHTLLNILHSTLYPVLEIILFINGIILIMFILKTNSRK